MPPPGRVAKAQATGRDGTVTLRNPQPPVARLPDLLCADDMICIRDRVTRDIQPGPSADGGGRLGGRTTQPVRIIKVHFRRTGRVSRTAPPACRPSSNRELG
jgi:hypothetical protein